MTVFRFALFSLLLIVPCVSPAAPVFPSVEVVPLPYKQMAFEIDGAEVARFHGGTSEPKSFLYPLIGPAGKRLTTMSHPVDPHGHRHHRSVWVGHRDVNGHNFWEETDGSRIEMTQLEAYGHEEGAAWFRAAHVWKNPAGEVVLKEERTFRVTKQKAGAYYLDLTMLFRVGDKGAVTFGKTPYGLLGVRVSPTVSVTFGGGKIINAEGDENEAGVHWKASRWADYSGPVAPEVINGAAFFDHPDNPGFPATYHVRDEGWMSASFTYDAPYVLEPGASVTLRYRIYVHGSEETPETLDGHWKQFSEK